jgi:dethiobiotin synthetase
LYRLRAPVSPHLAAEREGSAIDLGRIVDWVRSEEDTFFGPDPAGSGGVTLIESAGGVFSPLGSGHTNLDLAERLMPAVVVLVAPDSLGVLHDVTATLRAMGPHAVDLVALCQARPPDASTGTNGAELERAVFPALGSSVPKDRTVVTLFSGEKADFVADRILRRLDAV